MILYRGVVHIYYNKLFVFIVEVVNFLFRCIWLLFLFSVVVYAYMQTAVREYPLRIDSIAFVSFLSNSLKQCYNLLAMLNLNSSM